MSIINIKIHQINKKEVFLKILVKIQILIPKCLCRIKRNLL
jgi:hypothetical protein